MSQSKLGTHDCVMIAHRLVPPFRREAMTEAHPAIDVSAAPKIGLEFRGFLGDGRVFCRVCVGREFCVLF